MKRPTHFNFRTFKQFRRFKNDKYESKQDCYVRGLPLNVEQREIDIINQFS